MTINQANELISDCEKDLVSRYEQIDKTALYNQEKVLNAFRNNNVALRHFSGSSGYGYEDEGKGVLSKIFADTFGTEAGIVSPLIASGTHAISTALFGLLRPNDTIFSASGLPYDTLVPVINGDGNGSLKDFSIKFERADLTEEGGFDISAITKALTKKPKIVYLQRSRGYNWRESFSVKEIGEIIKLTRQYSGQSIVVVDNCYGEFTEATEPTAEGADIIIGSLIKNPGGGLAPTGGYICGKEQYISLIANRLTAPGLGTEVGSNAAGYRAYFQGFFLAPHTVAQCLKGALLFSSAFSKSGYKTLPKIEGGLRTMSDIICSIQFNTADELIKFCQSVQACSPVDSFAVPMPWDMPGYSDKVIMAAGTFVQGSSIELSADAPIRKPYTVYVQGGLTYEHIRIAAVKCLESIN